MKQELSARALKMTNSRLRENVASLKNKLRHLISCSEDSEIKSQRIDEMEDAVAAAGSIKVMFDSLVMRGRRVFEMDVITVTVDDSLERLWPEGYKDGGGSYFINSDNIFFADMPRLAAAFINLGQPVLRGPIKKGSVEFFPGALSRKVRSEALAPVMINGKLMCVVAFGSFNPYRFTENDGVRFLRRLCRTLALKMEIFLVRESTVSANTSKQMEIAVRSA